MFINFEISSGKHGSYRVWVSCKKKKQLLKFQIQQGLSSTGIPSSNLPQDYHSLAYHLTALILFLPFYIQAFLKGDI